MRDLLVKIVMYALYGVGRVIERITGKTIFFRGD